MKEVKKLKKQIKPKAQVVFLLLSIFVILVSVSSVSATPLPTSSQVYVSVNGSDTNDGSAEAPYLTIQKGVDSVSENGTVTILNGVYNGTGNTNITISKSMNITGQSQTGTIINGTGTNWIFYIPNGVNVTIQNLTLTNGKDYVDPYYNEVFGGAIYNKGSLTVSKCTFTGNTAMLGGAIANVNAKCVITDCTFIGNTARMDGGALDNNFGSVCTVKNCTFINNSAPEGGAILNINSGNLTVENSNFENNHSTSTSYGGGGAINNWGGITVAHFNSFVGNSANLQGSAIYCQSGSVNATNNWWGSNNPVWTNLISKMSNPTQWLSMTIDITPTAINNTQTSLVTVSFNNIYNGTAVTSIDPANGHIPDGTLVNFSKSTLGSFNHVTATTVNGIATALFTANQTGTDNITATTNTQTVKQLLTVNPASYLYLNITSSKNNPTVGETFVLTYKLSNSGPDNATNVTMSFQIPSGLEFVAASVDNGTWSYNPTNRTVTWSLTNVAVGDPYLYLSVRALGSGSYTILPTITSETFNQNNDPLMPFSISVQSQNNSNGNTVNAASTTKTVPMQTTGMPIAGLLLAILAVLGGIFTPRKK